MKSKCFTTFELEDIKRNKLRYRDEKNGTAVVEEANNGDEHELLVKNAKEMVSQTAQEAN